MGRATWLLLTVALAPVQPISEIKVEGNRNVPTEAILFHLQPLGAKPLTQPLIAAAFMRLWDTDLFEDIEFRRQGAGTDKTLLIVVVKEKRWLREVRSEGEHLFRTDTELQQKLSEAGVDLRARRPFGEEDARRAAGALDEILGKDYQATGRLVPVGLDRADLVLSVDKLVPVPIGTIAFVGNRALDDSRIRSIMQLETSGWVNRLMGRGRFESERLEEDLERIRDAYRRRGFISAEVGPARIDEQEGGTVGITIPIREGALYHTGSVAIDAGFLIEETTVRSWLLLTPGAPYNAVAVRSAVERIENHYRDDGYATVEVELDETLDRATRQVHLDLQVRPGRIQTFGRIDFSGNSWVRDRHLRQYLRAYEKGRFSGKAIATDERTLPALGLVESVAPETRASTTPNVVDVIYHVRERPRFEYFLGGSSNGVQGTYGSLSLTARDLLGRGESWDLEGDLGNRFGNFAIDYRDPFSIGRRLTWGSSFVRQEIEYPDETSDDSSSFSVRLFKPLSGRWQAQSGFQLASFELGTSLTLPVPYLTPFIGQRFRSHGVNLSFGYEGRNQPVFPTRGRQLLFGTEVAGGALGGNVSLANLRSRAQQLIPLTGRHFISLRARVDAVWPFGETKEEGLPRFERLFLGSEDDMRGFPIREVGPKTAEGVPIGGDRLVYASLEYQFALYRRARLVGFFDLGNVYALDLPDQGLPALRYDAGGELRIEAPILSVPLRFGYGFNLDRLAGEPKGRFFFSLSARF